MGLCRVLVAVVAALLVAQSAALAAGDGCRQGFVWREAFAGDHVCVVPGVRAQAREDNAQASSRVNQVNHDYGPDTCNGGYVWREADRADHVCVTPEIRNQTAQDNAAAVGRYAGTANTVQRSPPASRYDPAWQAAPNDTSCCPNNMLVCPFGRHFCR